MFPPVPNITIGVSREEFDALKAKVEEMIDLLKKAKEIDDKTGQPECEQDDKVALLKRIAKEFGYDLDFLGGNNAKATSPAATVPSVLRVGGAS